MGVGRFGGFRFRSLFTVGIGGSRRRRIGRGRRQPPSLPVRTAQLFTEARRWLGARESRRSPAANARSRKRRKTSRSFGRSTSGRSGGCPKRRPKHRATAHSPRANSIGCGRPTIALPRRSRCATIRSLGATWNDGCSGSSKRPQPVRPTTRPLAALLTDLKAKIAAAEQRAAAAADDGGLFARADLFTDQETKRPVGAAHTLPLAQLFGAPGRRGGPVGETGRFSGSPEPFRRGSIDRRF